MSNIMKVAINSQTFRVVFSDGKMRDFHVENGLASSLLMSFLRGVNFDNFYDSNIKEKYQWLDVNENDEFSWKSKTDGSGDINYVNKNDAQSEQANVGRSRRSYGTNFPMPIYARTLPAQIISPRPVSQPSTNAHNEREFKKLFGGTN